MIQIFQNLGSDFNVKEMRTLQQRKKCFCEKIVVVYSKERVAGITNSWAHAEPTQRVPIELGPALIA